MVSGGDNLGRLGRVNPLAHLQRCKRRHWEYDESAWDKKLAERIYRDLLIFIERRYPGIRWLVLAEVLLTAGARAAAKAGVDDDEIVDFVKENKTLRVPIAGNDKGTPYAGVSVGVSLPNREKIGENHG